MPFIHPTNPASRRTRVLINGAPNSGKSTSLLTFPALRIILSCPEERGYDVFPQDDPSTVSLMYEADQLTKNPSSTQVVDEVRKTLLGIIKGEHGIVHTLAIEGLHKLHARILDDLSGGEFFEGATTGGKDGIDPRAYGGAERKLFDFLSVACHSTIPLVIFTAWDEHEADRKAAMGEKWSDIPTHKMPALFGKTATRIMGEFSVIVHASKGKLSPADKEAVYRWQTRPSGDVWGCGIKAPVAITDKIPLYIPQSWPTLAGYLGITLKGDALA